MSERVIGILSGPFDPVLSVHILAARKVLDSGLADLVCFFPSVDPCAASYEDRCRMLVAACSADRRFIPFCPPASSGDPARLLKKEFEGARLLPLEETFPVFPADAVCRDVSAPSGLLSPDVREYISCLGLYGAGERLEGADCWIPMLFSSLKPRRYAHSLSVAGEAKKLARIHGLDVLRAEQAGLLHDCAKSIPAAKMQALAREHHLTDDPGFLASTALLHSLAGAYVAREKYGMKDPQVLQAIRYHNTGHAGMSRLDMCVCLADSIEPLRDPYPFLPEARALSLVSLEKALLLSLERTAEYVLSRGRDLHTRTLDTIAWLKTLPACAET